MNFTNVLIVYNREFYKEIDLDEFEKEIVTLGSYEDCDIKLKLQDRINIKFIKKNSFWQVEDGESTYSVINGIRAHRRILCNGDKLIIKSSISKKEIFKINYFIDFVVEKENYDMVVPLENKKKITIGSDKGNNIVISDDLVNRFHAEIKLNKNNQYYISDLKSKFGVYLNGKKVEISTYLKDNDFIIICGYKFFFKDKSIAMSKLNEKIRVNKLKVSKNNYTASLLEYPCFHRSPRLLNDMSEYKIQIENPPDKIKNSSNSMLITLIPVLGMMVITMSMMRSQSGQGMNMLYSVGMIAVTGIATLLAYIFQTINTKKMQFARYRNYLKYIKEKEETIKKKKDYIINNLKEMNPTSKECLEFVMGFNRRLWERRPEHKDFLNIEVGTGSIKNDFGIRIQEEKMEIESDKLREAPKRIVSKYNSIDNVPICINFTEDFPIGIYGNRKFSIELIKNIIIKISTLHYYEDVKLVVIYPENEEKQWNWIRWLPHVWDSKQQLRFMANSKKTAHNVLNSVYDMVKEREPKDDNKKNVNYPHFIIIIADESLVENEAIMPLLESNFDYGLTGIFVYDYINLIPKECKKLIEVNNSGSVKIVNSSNKNEVTNVEFNEVDDKICNAFSRRMSPVFVKTSFTVSALASYITMFDLYGIKTVNELKILDYWNNNKVYKTMAVPIGVKLGDEKVFLNLHEKYHGPHGLVAGTTGSGKSELLQTYIASLAINYHPYDVAIIIIDYKGGGMANQFKELPHLVGTITNLDGNQINRSLVSIKSELKRRQRIFAENNVNHIDAYIKLYKAGKASEPIPHLIIIADEFAELKSDQPDFMRELVSTARIGRSLGVHLILATQKPAGVVDNQIWSNSKFKLCLKVQNSEDSKEVLKSPLAANIVEPGRAYFQVGNNEIFELFQSAWSGAKTYDEDDVNKKEIEISEVSIDGTRKVIYSSKNEKNGKTETQLDAIIRKIKDTAVENNIKKLKGPWLPPLKEIIYLKEVFNKANRTGHEKMRYSIEPIVGMLDDPERQSQRPLKIDLSENGHLLIIGSPGTGKTLLIETIITSIIYEYSSDEVNMYILDFGARTLKIFEKAPQVGGILFSDDEELIFNFIKFIYKEMGKRKNLLSSRGVSSILGYKEATGEKIPQVVVIIDNFSGFLELYPDFEDDITVFSRECANLGISFIITASNTTEVRYKISSNFKLNVALNCVDKGEYSNLFGRVTVQPAGNPGRGLIKLDKVYEFQAALPVQSSTEVERADKIRKLVEDIASKWKGKGAAKIPQIPKVLNIEDMYKEFDINVRSGVIPVGINISEIEPEYIDLNNNALLTLVGSSKTGKSNLLKYIVYSINKSKYNADIYLFDSNGFGLLQLKGMEGISAYSSDVNEFKDILMPIRDELSARKESLSKILVENKGYIDKNKMINDFRKKVIIIDDIGYFVSNFTDDYDSASAIADIVKEFRFYGANVIASGSESEFIDNEYTYDFIDIMKKNNIGVTFDSIEEQHFYEVKLKFGSHEKPMNISECFYVDKGDYSRIKIPLYK